MLTATRALTAAHCLDVDLSPSNFSLTAGSTLRNSSGDPNAQVRVLSRFIQHPWWSLKSYFEGDIAIAYFDKPLIFGATVRPISLPPLDYQVPYGALAVTTGWGAINSEMEQPKRLQVIATPIWTNAQCNRAYFERIFPDMICSGQTGQTTCAGDSGGPLVVGGIQIGVVSHGRQCGKNPGVYARVPFHVKWIRENI